MKTVILVERNRHVRQFISRELQAMGYHVRAFRNGKEFLDALCVIAHEIPIIIERDLTDMDIQHAITAIRQHRPCQPIVVHSFDDATELCGTNNIFVAKKQSNLGELIAVLGRIGKKKDTGETEKTV